MKISKKILQSSILKIPNLRGVNVTIGADAGGGGAPPIAIWIYCGINGYSGSPVKVRLKLATGEIFYYQHLYRKDDSPHTQESMMNYAAACLFCGGLEPEDILNLAEQAGHEVRLPIDEIIFPDYQKPCLTN